MNEVGALPDEPDLTLAGLSVWAQARAFPHADDFWDGNWINIHASVRTPGAYIEIDGPCLRSSELATFMQGLTAVYENITGTATLNCIEPNLRATVVCDSLGRIGVTIDITPDHLTQSHRFHFAIDQTYLAATLAGCRHILAKYPVKGDPAA